MRMCTCCGWDEAVKYSSVGSCYYCYEHCRLPGRDGKRKHEGVTRQEFEEYRYYIIAAAEYRDHLILKNSKFVAQGEVHGHGETDETGVQGH